ncbi:MAG: peptidylprolyl isomerase, partial [Aquihabitans sp.]
IERLDDLLDGFDDLTIETATAAEFVTALVEIEILSGVLSDADLEISQADRDEQTEALAEKLKTEQQIDDMEPFEALVRLEIERNLLYEKVTEAASSPDDYEAELRAAYEENSSNLEELCVHIIVTEDQAAAQAAYERVTSGEDFSSVATEVSIDETSAPSGGDIGCIPRAGIANVFGDVATTAKPGDVLAPADGEGSWLMIQVDDVNMPTFEEARETLTQMVPDNSEAAVQELLAEAFTSAEVTIDARYGTWNPDNGAVTPPVDPAPTTTEAIPMLDPAAMDPAGS